MAIRPGSLLTELKTSHSLRRAMYIYMTVTVVLFVIILSMTVHQTVSSNNEQWQMEARASIRQAQALNNSSVRSISDYMLQRMESYEVRGLLYSADYTAFLNIHARDIYDQLTGISNLVKSIQMINYQTNTVIDHNGRYRFDLYGDQGILTLLESLEPSSHTRIYFHPRVMNFSASKVRPVEKRVISMVYYLNRAGALVVNLDYDLYKAMILSAGEGSPTDYYLYNNEGMIFCATDDSLFATSMTQNTIFDQAMNSTGEEGCFNISNGSVTYARSTALGANYIAVTKKDGIYPGSHLFWQVISLAMIFLLASAMISIGLALLTSSPIRALHKSVREQLTEDLQPRDELDEITFLDSVYRNILDSNRTLTENSKVYQMEQESQMLLNLMNPISPSLRASAASISELETKFDQPLFRVIALMPDRRHIQLETDAQAIRHHIATSIGEHLRTLGTVRTVFPPSFQVLFLLNADEASLSRLRETLMQIHSDCEQTLGGMALYMGVGAETTSLDDIAESYSGAEEAVQQAYVRQIDQPAFMEELSFPALDTQHYAFDLDEEITRAIRHMEYAEAQSAIIRFFDRVSGFYHNQYVRSTLHLDVVFQRLEISLQLESPDQASRIDTATAMHWNAQDACQHFIHRAHMDIAQLQDMKKTSSGGNELVEKIDRMIDENIFKPDFSIAQLADEFSFSVNYLRSLYKAGTGESLSARITRKRVEAACQLLDQTDQTIEIITQKLGFSTRNYFFTFFKKHMGMTPAQYRSR